jgi:putative MATE family efflux protein
VSELRTIARHAGTVLVGQLAVMAFGIADTIVAGRYAQEALAALSVGSAVYISVFVALIGMLQSLLPIWAELHGGQRHADIGRSVRQALYLAGLGLVAGCAALFFPDLVFQWTQVPPALQDVVRGYLSVLALALPPALLFRIFSTLNQSLGKPVLVTWLQALSLPFKVVLTIWFVFGGLGLPAQGAVGCAWATVAVNYLMLACSLWLIRTQSLYTPYAIWARMEKPDWHAIAQFARLGIPSGLSVMVEVTAFTLMALFISRQGTQATAAHQVVGNLAAVMYMVPLSIAIATSARVSYWLGAGEAGHPPPRRDPHRLQIGSGPDFQHRGRRGAGPWPDCRRVFQRSRRRGRRGRPAGLGRRLPRRRCDAGAVRFRAALLPRRRRAARRVLRLALGCRPGRRLRAGVSRHRAVARAALAREFLGREHDGARAARLHPASDSLAGRALVPAGTVAGRNRLAENWIAKVDPVPGVLSIFSSAPCRCTTCLTMARPRPVPPVSRERLRSTR